jgi:hypothetical protein
MPEWTVKKHEQLLNDMTPFDEKVRLNVMKKDEYDKIYRTNMILSSLHEIDKNVTETHLQSLHPDDFIDLWFAVYNSGKKGIELTTNLDFQKGEKTPP